MKKRLFKHTGKLSVELACLPNLDREELIERWHVLYGTEPPDGSHRKFLMYAIAYRLQEQVLGGMKPPIRRFLKNPQQALPSLSIKTGTRLLREWHGVTYEVIIMKDSIHCNGKSFRSLSEAARSITGTRWSGPRFFGLEKRKK
ncbi:MAG: DUF2924 domain-containing protein [Syntrophaceae bacterium]|nr:DUF2924 domain-containing protein [Syntrophaceae bacterium]